LPLGFQAPSPVFCLLFGHTSTRKFGLQLRQLGVNQGELLGSNHERTRRGHTHTLATLIGFGLNCGPTFEAAADATSTWAHSKGSTSKNTIQLVTTVGTIRRNPRHDILRKQVFETQTTKGGASIIARALARRQGNLRGRLPGGACQETPRNAQRAQCAGSIKHSGAQHAHHTECTEHGTRSLVYSRGP
jgi:hypothetical protein